MKTLNDLWTFRFQKHLKEIGKYGRLIFNDHLTIILFVLLGFGALAYQDVLANLTASVSATERIAVLLIGLIVYVLIFLNHQPLWLMKTADQSYLFPRGADFDGYWLKGTVMGEIGPTLAIIAVSFIYFPVFVLVTDWTMSGLWIFIVFVLLARWLCSLLMHLTLYQAFPKIILQQPAPLFLAECAVIYLLILFVMPVHFGLLINGVLLIGGWLYFFIKYRSRQNQAIDFQFAIDTDIRRQERFYRIVSLFADVPQSHSTIKRRGYLDRWLQGLSINRHRYGFLFIRQLLRNEQYSSVWLKVTLFMSVLFMLTDIHWLLLMIGAIGMVMTLVQWLPMMHLYSHHPMQLIYPNQDARRLEGFQQAVRPLLVAQYIVFILLMLVTQPLMTAVVLAVFWAVFLALLIYVYTPWWYQKQLKKGGNYEKRTV